MQLLDKFQFELVYKPMNNLNSFIKTGKDKIKKDELLNVVYQINYKDCDYSYVGQTKRKLKTRLKEHINDLKNQLILTPLSQITDLTQIM